jgi:hypothetical protein
MRFVHEVTVARSSALCLKFAIKVEPGTSPTVREGSALEPLNI